MGWSVLRPLKQIRALAATGLFLLSGCGGSRVLALCSPGLLGPSLDPPERFEGNDEGSGSARVGSRLAAYRVIGGQLVMEGDIVLGAASRVGSDPRASSVLTYGDRLWPGGVIPYQLDPNLPNPQRVTAAIEHWNQRLGGKVKLVPHGIENDWAFFARSGSPSTCASSVGRYGGQQTVFVGDGCGTGNLIHEIGHLVGLWHEQNRQDRDQFVIIHWENVDPAQTSQFALSGIWGHDFGAYDYASVMHYPPDAFSSNGKATIETIPAGTPIGQRIRLSNGDVASAQALYGSNSSAALAGCGF